MKTAIETCEKIKKEVVAIGQDVYLLDLLTGLTPDYMDILMLKEVGSFDLDGEHVEHVKQINMSLQIKCHKFGIEFKTKNRVGYYIST
ncbi:hypothetical protein AVEN_15454-1 [Araneus ventricosus]|uniref:Uncharacterized protein n=1 Tax=Araneus ventricosus TaxID=182803 RepID=A0A4Y2EF14_ARAVE|nr:hypothetical protein AVEN_15454-1 [Araneus ventricosus]